MLTKSARKEFFFEVDIEKAFDSVDHNVIFAALKKFVFGDSFL